ncbi:MAG: FAD-dependent oxidoreductase, partial [Clostridia bacterium]|nr:FAD-dependent oxidoreductase [Clostridia bacterium]
MYDVIIIGGGVTGSLTARLLSRYQLKIALVEKGADVAWESSRANSSISHAGYDCQSGTLKAKLNVRGTELMPSVCEELGVHYRRIGSHFVAFSKEDVETIHELLERGNRNGVPGLRILSQEELREMEPNISKEAVASLYAPTAGVVCTYGLTIAAAENAALNGADIFLNTKITSARYEKDHWILSGSEKTLEGRYVVNAAGVCAPEIARILGENDFPIVSKPSRGQYLILDKQYGNMAHSTLFVTPSEKGKGILVSPTPDGNLIVGPNAEPVDGDEDRETTAAGLAEVSSGGLRLMPNLPLRSVIKSFAGVRPNATQYDFYVAPSTRLPAVIHGAALGSPGLASSPA